MRVAVAVAVITDPQQRILITRRPLHAPHGGMWEFPGGKLEEAESAEAALKREIQEEVGIVVKGFHYLGEVKHHYSPDQSLSLLTYHVHDYEGEPLCCEAQMDLRWVAIHDLHEYTFPAANMKIMDLIQRHLMLNPLDQFVQPPQ